MSLAKAIYMYKIITTDTEKYFYLASRLLSWAFNALHESSQLAVDTAVAASWPCALLLQSRVRSLSDEGVEALPVGVLPLLLLDEQVAVGGSPIKQMQAY